MVTGWQGSERGGAGISRASWYGCAPSLPSTPACAVYQPWASAGLSGAQPGPRRTGPLELLGFEPRNQYTPGWKHLVNNRYMLGLVLLLTKHSVYSMVLAAKVLDTR